MNACRLTFVLLAVLATGPLACQRRPEPPATQPASRPAEPPATAPASRLPLPQAADWSRAQALERLDDKQRDTRLSAAWRLLQLDKLSDALPEPLEECDVMALGEDQWVLGRLGDDRRYLVAPVVFAADGPARVLLAGDPERATARLWVSDLTELMPHLLLTTTRVYALGEEPRIMLAAGDLAGCRFAVRNEEGLPYLALLHGTGPDAAEVARYDYDGYEESFYGPASDELPPPAEGRFELDLDASEGLVPVGGELDEPNEPNVPMLPLDFNYPLPIPPY